MKSRLVILIFILNIFHCYSQIDTTRGTISKVVYDSLLITTKDPVYIKVEIDRLKFRKGTGCDHCESTDISMTIKDYKNNILYKSNSPALFDSWDYLKPSSVYLEGIGNVLAINKTSFPSVASNEGSIMIFGRNSYGYIIPMTDYIPISGKFDDSVLFKVYKINKSSVLKNIKARCRDCDYCLETCNFTGWCGFDTGQFYHISLEGIIDSKPIEFDTIPIYAGVSNYATIKELKKHINERTVALYPSPFLNSTPKNIPLKVNSTIKFFYILRKNNQSVIFLRINGFEGYIRDFNELDKLGFPGCG